MYAQLSDWILPLSWKKNLLKVIQFLPLNMCFWFLDAFDLFNINLLH